MTANDDVRALAGVRVLDFGHFVAAPHAAWQLCNMGAEVIKIERPIRGDDLRREPHIYEEGLSGSFMQRNWGKKSLSIDLRNPAALPILEGLATKADVLIQNFRPGVMEKIGIGYSRLTEFNPRIIYCSISAYGQDGPYANRVGFGPIVEAAAGLVDLVGDADGPPQPIRSPIADNMAGAIAVGAICAALYARDRTGRGNHIDLSLLDAAFQMHDFAVSQYLGSGGTITPTRHGIRSEGFVPTGFYETVDGWIVMMIGNETHWRRLVETMGREDMLGSQYAGWEARQARADEIHTAIEQWVRSFPSTEALLNRLVAADVPCERVNDVAHAVQHPQIKARNMLVDMHHPVIGPMQTINSGIRLANGRADVHGLPPDLGEHNREILTDLLGYPQAEIDRLHDQGVLYMTERLATADSRSH